MRGGDSQRGSVVTMHPTGNTTFDTIVIGAGQAGPALAATLAGRGDRVAIIEQSHLGGTCVNTGCRPTKAIRASARAAHVARSSAALGVHCAEVQVDFAEVIGRKDTMLAGWRAGSNSWLENDPTITLYRGAARFDGTEAGEHIVAIDGGPQDGQRLRASRVIINTGGRSVPPPIAGLEETPWLDHVGILDLKELPRHLVVLGGSYIGLEFAQIFRRFGSTVTVVERAPRIVAREDVEISAAIASFLRAEEIDVIEATETTAVSSTDDGVAVALSDGRIIAASHILVASGRVPNSDRLGLESVGVERDGRGFITTTDVFETSAAGIYAVGDVNGRGAFTHTSYQDYEILADHLGGGSRTVAGRGTTYALFTDPPLGRVGMTFEEARRSGRSISTVSFPMAHVTKAVLDGETNGLVHIVTDTATGQILGAACLGLHGEETVQSISLLMHVGAPVSALASWLPIHPTVTEYFPTIAGQLTPASM